MKLTKVGLTAFGNGAEMQTLDDYLIDIETRIRMIEEKKTDDVENLIDDGVQTWVDNNLESYLSDQITSFFETRTGKNTLKDIVTDITDGMDIPNDEHIDEMIDNKLYDYDDHGDRISDLENKIEELESATNDIEKLDADTIINLINTDDRIVTAIIKRFAVILDKNNKVCNNNENKTEDSNA